MTVTARPRVARYVLILGGLSAFGPLSVDMYLPALPRMAGDLQTAATTVQLTLSAFVLGLGVGQLVAGPLSDALGRRRPLLAGLVLYVVGSVLCAYSGDAAMLIAARGVQALGAAAGIVIARAAVRDLFSGKAMTRFFSMLMLVSGLGPVLAPVLGGQLLRWTSWRGVFVVLTVFGALLLIVVLTALPESLPPERRSPPHPGAMLRTYLRLLGDRVFVGYALAGALLFSAMFAYISGSSFALQGGYGLSPQLYSLVFAANGCGIVLAGQLNARLVGRFPERRLLAVALALAAAAGLGIVVAAVAGHSLFALLIPLFVLVSTVGLVLPDASSLALDAHAATAGAASALLGVLQFVLGAVATPLVGLGGPATAVPMAVVMAAFATLALLAFALLFRPRAASGTPG